MPGRANRDHLGRQVPRATSDGAIADGWLANNGALLERLVSSGELSPEVGARIHGYRPHQSPYWQSWPLLAAFVTRVVLCVRPPTVASAQKSMVVVTRIAHWAKTEGMPLEEEVVFDPQRVDQFVSCAEFSTVDSRNDYRSRLRAIGRTVTRRAPWPSNPERVAHRNMAAPYSGDEVDLLLADIEVQVPSVKRAAEAAHFLGLGVGPRPAELMCVSADDVVRINGVWCVSLGTPSSVARQVPILPRYVPLILELVERYPEGPLVHSRSSEVHLCDFLNRFKTGNGTPRPTSWRYRSTWLLSHLNLGTRLDVLTSAAGVRELRGLHGLLTHLPRLDDEAARQLLVGGGR